MWRFILRISVLVSVCMILYTQSTPVNEAPPSPGDNDTPVNEAPPSPGDNDAQINNEAPPPEDDEGENNGRRKRSVILANERMWDKCIIPYVYDGAYNSDIESTDIGFALKLYHKYTGFRFIQYGPSDTVGDNTQWGLPHTSYADMIAGTGSCWSYVGRSASGPTSLTPCKQYTAAHEFGHLLGLQHEHMSPKSIGEVFFHEENIAESNLNLFTHMNTYDLYDVNNSVYDPSSIMHYFYKLFNKNKGHTLSLLDERDDGYLVSTDNWYYDFKALQEKSGCFAEYDCSSAPTCQNDGYRSIVNDVCTCMCPKGLAPESGCTTPSIVEKTSYPSGKYSLLMAPNVECPSGFQSGHMVLYAKKGKLHDPTFSPGSYLHIAPGYVVGELHHKVCTKTNPSGSYDWPPGEYCILRYSNSCPTGFVEGTVTMQGSKASSENGTVPDGLHSDVFEYIFCCREDYSDKEEIDLPIPDPFVLYQVGSKCQPVRDRYVVESWYTFHSMTLMTDTGLHPKVTKYPMGRHYYTKYCVYFPLNNDNCGNNLITLDSDTTSADILSPGYSTGTYPILQNCVWHVKAPEGTTIQLDFTEFSVSTTPAPSCSSYIVVKNWHPGFKNGRVICGDNYKKTIWSKYNTLSVEFVSGPDEEPNKKFKLNVKLIKETDKCYTGDGSGGQYYGTVNYSHDFKQCLPWSKVSHCLYNSYNQISFTDHLDSNYCRSTGYTQLPWCYVEADCEKRTCDVCLKGACYDRYTDCAAQIAADANYCTNNVFGEAARRCMLSCGFCDDHQPKPTVGSGTITCSAPDAIDGTSFTPVQSTYNVGDTVSYTCTANNVNMKRTCTSEGTWTDLNMVCGACPDGWSVYNKRCYKWLGIYSGRTVGEAKTMCSNMGASLPKILDQGTNDFIQRTVNIYQWKGAEIWLGLEKSSGVWRWPNDAYLYWTNWASGQPSNKDCAYMKDNGQWTALDCSSSSVIGHVVCEIEPSDGDDVATCKDRKQDCANFLSENPSTCEQYGDFAWHFCRKTCARGVCSTSTQCTDLGSLGSTGSIIHPTSASSIPVGNYVEYKCASGYYHTAGDLKRVCQFDGTLSGSLPTCSDAASTDRVVMNPDAVIRRRNDFKDNQKILTAQNEFTEIKMPGKITEWHFYSNMNGIVAFVVLRETAANTFTVVGKNVMSPTIDDGKVMFIVPAGDQITVQAGDRIGIYHDTYEMSFTSCDSAVMPENGGWLSSPLKATVSEISVSETIAFGSVSSATSCRMYSLHAVINPTA